MKNAAAQQKLERLRELGANAVSTSEQSRKKEKNVTPARMR
ncbi:hypothetical protein STIAU_5243 [Stigmatella aurantiaca DW4/3-1]|uniref:Uncharacterized protein n=1 Tax=Stigmatella aurantiaca (strain DW4/3-1) TaxID=378806 RepID=Q08PL9_STIAD|nr:hypothetical protein STIAU_5243 [Stigmatella aurantiaca DW4/3-1]